MLGRLYDFGLSDTALRAFIPPFHSFAGTTAAGLQALFKQALSAHLRSADPEALCTRLAVVATVAVAPAKDVMCFLLTPLDLLSLIHI